MSTQALKVYEIEEHEDTGPSITCIACYDSYPLIHKSIKRWSCPIWILDYPWIQAIPVRVGHARRPWRIREARTAHLYPPNTVFWEDFTNAKPGISGVNVLFKGGQAAGLNKLIRKGQKYAKFQDADGKLGQILNNLAQLPEKFGDDCFSAVQSAMWGIFHLLLTARYLENEDYVIENTHHMDDEESLSMQVESYMKTHYAEKLTLESISNAMNVSSATLRSKFRLEQKVSPMVRLNEIRINVAKNRLLRGERICEIATQIGFYDEFHLSKTFKKITGQSPREFIRGIHHEES